jgi:sulfatase maturation enzyme AslB (radical SAM superfamily)
MKFQYIEITTRVGCKISCSYCPQNVLISQYEKRSNIFEMNINTFMKCINKLPKNFGIVFSGFAEPFLNNECKKMVKYAYDSGFKTSIFTTTVGLKNNDIEFLKNINFDLFVVHLPGNKSKEKITVDENYFDRMDKIIENINNVIFQFPRDPWLYEDIHPRVKKYFKEKDIVIWKNLKNTRCKNVEINGLKNNKIKGSLLYCPRLNDNVLLPNGDVALCCMDFGIQHILGNLLLSDYKSIIDSDERKRVIKGLKDDSIDILCRYCSVARRKNILLRCYDSFRQKGLEYLNINSINYIKQYLKNK